MASCDRPSSLADSSSKPVRCRVMCEHARCAVCIVHACFVPPPVDHPIVRNRLTRVIIVRGVRVLFTGDAKDTDHLRIMNYSGDVTAADVGALAKYVAFNCVKTECVWRVGQRNSSQSSCSPRGARQTTRLYSGRVPNAD